MKKSFVRRRQGGLSLLEMLVVCGLFAVLGVVILSLYLCAYTEFENASGKMTLNRSARSLADKMLPILSTAVPVIGGSECFVHPDAQNNFNAEIYEVDFFSTECFIRDANPGSQPFNQNIVNPANSPITYGGNISTPGNVSYLGSFGSMWWDQGLTAWIWEIQPGTSQIIRRQPSYYRYRVAWTPDGNKPSGGANGWGFPARSVYMERLQLHWDSQNVQSIFTNSGKVPPDPDPRLNVDTGQRYPAANCGARLLAKDIAWCGFRRLPSIPCIEVHIRVYNIDNVNGVLRTLDGELMRDRNRQVKQRAYDIYTAVVVPNLTLK